MKAPYLLAVLLASSALLADAPEAPQPAKPATEAPAMPTVDIDEDHGAEDIG